MTPDLFAGLVLFSLVAAVTPGPNNVMLLASGANFGFSRTLPHMAGVTIGFSVIVILAGFGIGQALQAHDSVYLALKWGGIGYMLWLAWKIASAPTGDIGADADPGTARKPFTFMQAALFQWVNVKAWAAIVTATAAYSVPDSYMTSLVIIVVVFAVVTFPSVAMWTAFGVALRRFLADPVRQRAFNIAMAVLLVLSFLPVVFASVDTAS